MAKKSVPPVTEYEIAIQLSATDLEKVFNAFARKAGRQNIIHKFYPRDYYDTADLALDAHEESLRIQYKRGELGRLGAYEQTVKLKAESGNAVLEEGASLRQEFKDHLKSNKPSVAAISQRSARSRITKIIKNKPLKHIFTAEIERRYFNVTVGKGREKSVIEIAFESGQLFLPDRSAQRSYVGIELELKEGHARGLKQLKDKILKMAPSAKLQGRTKAQLGTALYRGKMG